MLADSIERLRAQWAAERPDIDTGALAIFARLQRLGDILLRHSGEWLEPMGLTWEAFSLIVTLRRCGEPYAMRPTEIYRASLLSSGAVTNRVDRVERLGLVTRLPDPTDGRGVIVQLTARGKDLADRSIETHCAALRTLLANLLAPPDQEALIPLLAKLLLAVESADASPKSQRL